MIRLSLYFTSSGTLQLYKTAFIHPLLEEEQLAVRGKSKGAYHGYGSFQWTSAVQALSILLLKSVSAVEEYVLEGEAHSPAASLDYALSRQPAWLVDMFGIDAKGDTLARRFITRTNSDRKRGGPVSLSIRSSALAASAISIFVDGEEINDLDLIDALVDSILKSWRPRKSHFRQEEKDATQPNCDQFLTKLLGMLKSETLAMLRRTNIFNPTATAEIIARINSDPSFIAITGKQVDLVDPIDKALCASARVGICESLSYLKNTINKQEPLSIALPIGFPSLLGMLQYLKNVKAYNLDINYLNANAIDIKNKILAQDFIKPPDLCLLGIAPAAELLKRGTSCEYRPLMLMPRVSQRVVAPKGSRIRELDLNYGKYIFLRDDPSTASFYFNDMQRTGIIDKHKVSVAHAESDEAMQSLNSGDPELRAVLFFPYYCFNQAFNDCVYLDDAQSEFSCKEAILFAHESFLADKERARCFDIAIRDAWLELSAGGKPLDNIFRTMLTDSTYVNSLKRFSGLYW